MFILKPTHFELVSECPVTRRLEAWSRFQATGMLAFAGAASGLQDTRVLAGFVAFSFVVLVVVGRGSWSIRGDFGWGNCVTALRLSLLLVMTFGLGQASNLVWGSLALLIFALDGIDGWLARLTHSESTFGAHFDMETDAAFVAVISYALWQRSLFGPWVLIPGLYRYLYVLFNSAMDVDAPEMPRSWFGRVAYSSIVLGLTSAFFLPHAWGLGAAWCGTGLLTLSFARSFLWIWSHRATAKH